MNGRQKEALLQQGREQVAKPLEEKVREIGNTVKDWGDKATSDIEFVLDTVGEFVTEYKDDSLGIERMTTFADLTEDHDVTIVLGIFRKYCEENGYCRNSEEIHNFIKKIGDAERIVSFRKGVSYEDIKKAEDKVETSKLLFELISLYNFFSENMYNEDIYNKICKNLTISQSDLDDIRGYISENVGNYELSKWEELLLGQTDKTDDVPYSHDNRDLLDSDEKVQYQGRVETIRVDSVDSGKTLQKDSAKMMDSDIREIVNKYADKISGNLKRDNKEWEKILADSGYNNIAMPSVCAIFKSGQKKMIVTTCAVYYTGYTDKDKNWTIRYSDLKEVKINLKEKTLSFQSDKEYTINWKKDFGNLAEMLGEIQEKDQYPQSDRYIVIQNMGRINRIRYVAVAYYIMKKSQCDDCEIFRLASKYKVEEDWGVIVNLISNDEGYKKTIQELMASQELMYSQKMVAISLIADVCGSYLYAKDEYNLSISIKRSFGELEAYLKCDNSKNDSNEIILSTIEVSTKEKELLENKIPFAEYAKTIENFSAIVGAAGIFGIAYAFAWGPLWLVFMSFMPGIGQIAAAAVAGGLLIKKALNKTTEKKEKAIDLKKQKIYAYACEYAYAQKACERIGNYETAKKLKENRKRMFKKADISFSVRVPNVENDLIVQIRELLVNELEGHSSWETYLQLSEKTLLLLKDIFRDVAEGNGICFSEKDIVGIYKEKSWDDDYTYMKNSLSCKCIVFCREGLLFKYIDEARYVRYVDIESVNTVGDDLQCVSLWIQPKELAFVFGSDYDLSVIYKIFSKLFDIVKDGCTVYS